MEPGHLFRGTARAWLPSAFGIGTAALLVFVYSSGVVGAILLVVLGLPSAVGGLALYFEYGRRRALAAALANLTVVLAFAAVNRALGNGGGGGGGMPPPASVR